MLFSINPLLPLARSCLDTTGALNRRAHECDPLLDAVLAVEEFSVLLDDIVYGPVTGSCEVTPEVCEARCKLITVRLC